MAAEVVVLNETSLLDIPGKLRMWAAMIEKGEVEPRTAILVLWDGREVDVSAFGEESDAASVHLTLHAGMMKLARTLLP